MFFFKKKKKSFAPVQKQIHCFVRYATYSSVSCHKTRPPNFSYELCHQNLLRTSDKRVHFTYLLDTYVDRPHFLKGQALEICEGTEASSFLKLLEHVVSLNLHPDTIVYFLEDDYLHKEGWVDALFEGFSLDADYVTLYDHKDKYRDYPKLKSTIFATPSCHWRTTVSTTNTYAARFGTILKDLWIHQRFSLYRKVTADHDKFLFLRKKGATLVSSLPGYSTHLDPEFLSPCTDWDALLTKELLCKH